jgi:hypothetical protein
MALGKCSFKMGFVEFHKPTGEKVTIDYDGTMIIEQDQGLELDYCDKCQTWQDKSLGAFEEYLGLKLLWFCESCK